MATRIQAGARSLAAVVLAHAVVAGASAQTTWYVDAGYPGCPGTGTSIDPFCMIQPAIDASVAGDLVLVLPGTYRENLDFRGKDITVRSDADGDPNTPRLRPDSTIVDGQGLGSVVKFIGGESRAATLMGFSLRHGMSSFGGGVLIQDSSPQLLHNWIQDNKAGSGGGVYATGSGLLLQGNRILRNDADLHGAGICLVDCLDDQAFILGNTITGNEGGTDGAGKGGGVYVKGFNDYRFSNNNIVGNRNDFGGGYHIQRGELEMYNETIVGNEARRSNGGDGISMSGTDRFGNAGYIHFINNILSDNGNNYEAYLRDGSHIDADFSDVNGGMAKIGPPGTSGFSWGRDMIDAAPLFVNADGADNNYATHADNDLHLTATSPCIDTGEPNHPPVVDHDANPRGPLRDMGADEFHPHAYLVGQPTPGGSVSLRVIDQPGTPVWQLWLSAVALEVPVSTSLGDWYLLRPWIKPLFDNISFVPANGVFSLTSTLPPGPPSDYDVHFQFIVGTPPALSGLVSMYVH